MSLQNMCDIIFPANNPGIITVLNIEMLLIFYSHLGFFLNAKATKDLKIVYDYLIHKKCIDVVYSLSIRKNFMIMFGLAHFESKMSMV